MAAEDERRDEAPERQSGRPGTGGALLWTAASVPFPGAAHLRMGRRRAGVLILGLYLLGIVALGLGAYLLGAHESGAMTVLAGMAVQDVWLLGAMGAVFAVAVLWMSVIVHSWVITRPEGRGRGRRLIGAVTVLLLCLTVAAPSAWALHAGYTAYETLEIGRASCRERV